VVHLLAVNKECKEIDSRSTYRAEQEDEGLQDAWDEQPVGNIM
jgi:hypothetical protein